MRRCFSSMELLIITRPVIPHDYPTSFFLGKRSSQMSKSRTVCTLRPLVSHLGEIWCHAVVLVWWLRGLDFFIFSIGHQRYAHTMDGRIMYMNCWTMTSLLKSELLMVQPCDVGFWNKLGFLGKIDTQKSMHIDFLHALSHGVKHAFRFTVQWHKWIPRKNTLQVNSCA